MSGSALTSWALLLWQELESRQLDTRAIFSEAGLDPDQLKNATARFPTQSMKTLWELAHKHTQDDAVGFHAGQRWSPTTGHALGFAWLASESLGDALHRLARYGALINDGVNYQLTVEQLLYRFTIVMKEPGASVPAPAADAGIAALLKMIRALLDDSFSPLEITCPHAPNGAGILLESLSRCPIKYQGDAIIFVFDRQDVEKKLPTGNNELSLMNEQIIIKHLAVLETDQLAARVENLIQQRLPSGTAKEEEIADELHMSERTLQRRLYEEGTSFSEILQRIRRALADQYVNDHSLAMSEVAYLLGFSEQANFTRAFKRWYGVSPTAFRDKQSA